jgi:hypothetical protein
MSDTTTSDEAWFYTQGGDRKGPVPADKLRELLAARTIDGETLIWRQGQSTWLPLRTTEIGAELKDVPPPIDASHVNNGWVWALAFAPIVYLFVEVAILGYRDSHPANDTFYEAFLSPLIWLIPLVANATLCLVDAEQLKRAGYSSGWMTLFALLLAPVYLFLRAQNLHQAPTYGFVWVASFIASIVLRVM